MPSTGHHDTPTHPHSMNASPANNKRINEKQSKTQSDAMASTHEEQTRTEHGCIRDTSYAAYSFNDDHSNVYFLRSYCTSSYSRHIAGNLPFPSQKSTC